MFKVFTAHGELVGECGSQAGALRVFQAMRQRGQSPLGIVESGVPVPMPFDEGELDAFINMKEDAHVCSA